MSSKVTASDINTLSTFLAHEQIKHLTDTTPTDCIVLCVSAIFHCAEAVFNALQHHPNLAKTLILCGGTGHSTPYLYAAVAKNPRYAHLYPKIQGLPEAGVLRVILDECFPGVKCRVLVEDRSTNCGANAIETRKVLEEHGVRMPETVVVVQDPSMARRTIASFEQAFAGLERPCLFWSCPTFVPVVRAGLDGVELAVEGVGNEELWDIDRFLDLVLGEIPRLRDDEAGYGPKGKGFIGHVDVPADVEEAYARLKMAVSSTR